jgi:exopolysaccharide biosynthesis polyprenyl glycosylphosphotransferase
MITGDIFRGRTPESGPRLARVANRPYTAPAGARSQARWHAVRWAAVTRHAVLPVSDGLALAVIALLAAPGWPAAGYAVAVLMLVNVSGRHRLRICLRVSDELPRLAASAALPVLLLLPWMGSTGSLARLAALSAGLLVTMRAVSYAVLRAAHRREWLTEPVLIVGTDKLGVEIGELLREHTDLGLRPVGFIDSQAPCPESSLPLLGEMSEVSEVVLEHGVGRIIVSFPAESDADLVSALRANRSLPAEVCVVPQMYELAAAIPRGCLDEVWGIPLVPLRRCGLRWSSRVAKRAFDLVIGVMLLVALGPVLLLLMLTVLLRCGRPVLFRQVRVTRSGRVMKITKLRTVSGRDPDARWTVAPDECSALCRWLRATHLDELPQLLNVVRGEMSLVGPRPERPFFTSRFAKVIPRYEDRHRTHSGMTGWAQVHGLTGDTSISDRVRFDNDYIEHWSLWLDVVILVRTIAEPLTGVRRDHRSRRRT